MKKRGKNRGHKSGRRHSAGAGHAATNSQSLVARSNSVKTPMRAVAAAPAYERDERQVLALLLLPFLVVALSLGLSQTLKPAAKIVESALPMRPAPAVVVPGRIALAPLTLPAAVPAALVAPPPPIVPPTVLAMPQAAPDFPAARIATPDVALATVPPTIVLALPQTDVVLPTAAPRMPSPPPPVTIATPALRLPASAPVIAFAMPRSPVALPTAAPDSFNPEASAQPPLSALACLPVPKRAVAPAPVTSSEFGARLAEAAVAQTSDFVIYNATYRRIAYPMGDVPSLYGTCSDLVIRAYRALGIDLQELVQQSRVGNGDPNIDHRRTETLRAFFARFGASFPPSAYGEDYKPGDIVTYYRPFSRVSRAHIAIVTDRLGPSGNPMIVHNRGWGPQVEDALFVDKITGHYRFSGAPSLVAAAIARPSGKALPATHHVKVPTEPKPIETSGRQRKAAVSARVQ